MPRCSAFDAQCRPAAQDNQPHLPVYRPQGLDRTYEWVGDLVAYDLVRAHFRVLAFDNGPDEYIAVLIPCQFTASARLRRVL